MVVGLGALQRVLAGEHAAVHVLGVLAAQTSASGQPTLYSAVSEDWQIHREERDSLIETITRAGGTPVAAAPSYDLPNQGLTPAEVTSAALQIEQRLAATWAAAVSETIGETRRAMAQGLDRCAVRQLRFRGSPESFPGTSGL